MPIGAPVGDKTVDLKSFSERRRRLGAEKDFLDTPATAGQFMEEGKVVFAAQENDIVAIVRHEVEVVVSAGAFGSPGMRRHVGRAAERDVVVWGEESRRNQPPSCREDEDVFDAEAPCQSLIHARGI